MGTVLAAVALGGLFLLGAAPRTIGDLPPAPAAGGRTVKALGRLEPGRGVVNVSALGAEVPGYRIDRLAAQPGQFVRSGDVLAYLDDYAQVLAQKHQDEAALGEARGLLEAETTRGRALIAEAEAALRRAREVLPQGILEGKANLQAAETDLNTAEMDLRRDEVLRARDSIAPEDYDHQAMTVQHDRNQVEALRCSLARLEADEQVSLAETAAKLETAKANLTAAQRAIGIDSAERRVGVDEENLRLATVRAPMDGQVLRVFVYPGERVGDRPVLQMGDVQHMYAVAEVYETDVRFVRPGQRAVVSSPALAADLTGVVEEVGQRVFKNDVLNIDPKADSDLRVFEVRIRLDDPAPAARMIYLQVDATIEVSDAPASPAPQASAARAGAWRL